ncbi:unnamed protein product [Auanema sp. JU1783]|nr:unnamed protein product [Auanema sp. JU1783]
MALVATSSSFSLLITINRALAVSVKMSDRAKKLVLKLFFGQVLVQLLLLVVIAFTIENHKEEGRNICLKKIEVYPEEMDTMNGVFFMLSTDIAMFTLMSAQFLANQRRLTVGVFSFMMAEFFGLAIPMMCINICAALNIGTVVVYQFGMISFCVYPAFGSYFVLMSNTDYRNRIHSIFRRAGKVTTLTRDQTTVT